MKMLFLFIASCACLSLSAQEKRGASPIPHSEFPNPKSTRAVVVGISDYADERIPDLKYAHRDAEAFADYLRSPAGGSLSADQLTLLTNTQATAGKIIAAFDWLIAESEPGDRVLIYFSGHGDVERLTKFQRGYLLCHDAPGTTYMAGGSFAVGSLEDIISTLSEAGVQVIMISDACRSGKLAGSEYGGTQATTALLAQQFSHEIKILSCQPEEFSLEGEEWGGGRGCFSYHLVDALTGLADANADGSVNLLETGHYLEEKVPAETDPHVQIPMTVGNKSTALATVQPEALEALRQRKTGNVSTLSPIDAKGFEDMVLAKADTSVQRLYAAFSAALQRGDLLTPPGASANDYYGQLLPKPGIEKLKGLMTRNLAAALQDEAQVVINQLLRTDPAIIDDAYSPVSKYDHLPGYLHQAAELLGEQHYMYQFIKAREYYFKAKTFRTENYPDLPPDSLTGLAVARLDTALMYDSTAAYAYFEKGIQFFFGFGPDYFSKSFLYFEKAQEWSPRWAWATHFVGISYGVIANKGEWHYREKAIKQFETAISIDSMLLSSYRWLADVSWGGEKAGYWRELFVRKMQEYLQTNPRHTPALYYNDLGNVLIRLKRFEESEVALLKGVEISGDKFPNIYNNLSFLYIEMGRYEDAEKASLRALELRPSFEYYVKGQLAIIRYFFLNQPWQEAATAYRELMELNPHNYVNYELLSIVFLENNQLDSAEQLMQQWVASGDKRQWLIMQYQGRLYMLKGQPEKARPAFEYLVESIQSNQNKFWPYQAYIRIITDFQLGKTDSLQAFIQELSQIEDINPNLLFYVASAFAYNGQNELALAWLEKAFEKGWQGSAKANIADTLWDPDLMYLRRTPEFKALLKKYFPDQVKD